jgi:hypothetical protein
MLAEVRTGPIVTGDGSVNPARSTRDGSLIVGAGLADYQELAFRGYVFQGANQGPGGTTTTVGLATTYTGLCISNPANSTKNLVMLQCGIGVVGAPAALSTLGLLGGYAAGGITAHTTPLVPLSTFLGPTVATGVAKADAACTLVGTPTLLMPFGVTPITGATAQVVNPPVILNVYDIKGSIILPPGAYIAIYTSTVLSIIGGFTWAEVPV